MSTVNIEYLQVGSKYYELAAAVIALQADHEQPLTGLVADVIGQYLQSYGVTLLV